MHKKFIWLVVVLSAVAVLFILGSNVLADLTGDPFSGEPDSNENAWYDETWLAVKFYNLERVGASANYKYVQRTSGNIAAQAATVKPDLVVTEWHVTGHVHFTSSGL